MKILIIGLGRINTQNEDGGSVRLKNILREFSTYKDLEIDFLLPERDFSRFKGVNSKINFQLLRDLPFFEQSVLLHYIYRTLVAALRMLRSKHHYDVIYSASDFFHDFIPSLVYKAKFPETRFISCLFLVARNPFSKKETFSLFQSLFYISQQLIMRVMGRYCDKVFVLNKADKKNLVSKGVVVDKVKVVTMGVDLEFIKSVSAKEGDYYAGYVGRVHPQKGIFVLLEAWKGLLKRIPDAKLFLIGGGSAEDVLELEKKIKELDLRNNVSYLGFKPNDEIFSYIKSCKVFVVPSFYESWGQVVVEGLSCGKPVVTFDIPIFRTLFDGEVIFAQSFDSSDLMNKIISAGSSNRRDSGFVERFDWKYVARKEYEEFRN